MRGFYFTMDSVVALIFLLFFAVFMIAYVNSFSYSRLTEYESMQFTESVLSTMKSNGELNAAAQNIIEGKTNQARNALRDDLKNYYSSKQNKYLKMDLYNSAVSLAYELEVSSPGNAKPTFADSVVVSRKTFVYGGYYGTATLQVW